MLDSLGTKAGRRLKDIVNRPNATHTVEAANDNWVPSNYQV